MATVTTVASVMCWQSDRLSDESWVHFETSAATAASSTVLDHLGRLACLRSAAAPAASQKAFETSSASGFFDRLGQ
tara:strand:- start:603 stop:830 length:228 start_codon:yes stop_codon:yes gene_type:complete